MRTLYLSYCARGVFNAWSVCKNVDKTVQNSTTKWHNTIVVCKAPCGLSVSHTKLCNPWLWQPAVGHAFVARLAHLVMKPHGAVHPLDARLTGCLRQVSSKSRRFDLTPTRLDKILFCMVTDSHSESEEIQLYLLHAVAVSLEFT